MQTTTGTITIGGKSYPTLTFNYLGSTYTYMTENLDLDVGAGCKYYDNDPSNAQQYGRLYTLEAAKKAIPNGWDIIDYDGWRVLENVFLDGFSSPTSKLVQGGSSGLNFQYGGRLDRTSNKFVDKGDMGCYWSPPAINAQKGCASYLESPAKGGYMRTVIDGIDSAMRSVRFFKEDNSDPADPTLEETEKRAGFTYGSLVDNRPDNSGFKFTYRSIRLKDGKEWMAENFNFLMSKTGDDEWQTLGSFNSYNNPAPQTRVGYGLYYTWDAIQAALPAGWRLPTVEEWQSLIQAYGGASNAYAALLNKGTSGIDLQLLSWRAGATYSMSGMGDLGYFWSGSEGRDTKVAACLHLKKDGKKAEILYLPKRHYHNVRLIKK